MARLCVSSFGLSLDGFGAGPDQAVAHPLGRGGEALHEWAFATRTFHQMTGRDGGETGIDDDMFAAGRPRTRPLERRPLARLVGRGSAVSRPGLCLDPPAS